MHFVYLIMFTIEYTAPYSNEIRRQSFDTLEDAQSMIAFYENCGTAAWLI